MASLKLNSSKLFAFALAGVVAGGLMLFLLFKISNYADYATKEREETVVRNGLAAKINELEQVIVPNVVWDDAVRNLDNSFNLAWAHNNIGQFYSVAYGFDFAYVLDASNKPVYAMKDGLDEDARSFEDIKGLTSKIVENVRSREARKPTAILPAAAPSNLRSRIQDTVAARIGDRFFYITASLVQPDFGTATIAHAAAPILILGQEVDGKFLDSFAKRYMLDGAHVHQYDARDERDETHIIIHDGADRPIATLDWWSQKPGQALFDKILPWALLSFSLSLAGGLLLYLRARDSKDRLGETEQRALFAAHHDKLTQLHNRTHLELSLARMTDRSIRTKNRFVVYAIDLDRFTSLNEVYGYEAGNELLKEMAARISSLCAADDICARHGGDSFVVLRPFKGQRQILDFADRLSDAIRQPVTLKIGIRSIDVSIGIAVSDLDGGDALEYLRRAELALNQAKQDGRGRSYVFDEKIDEQLRRRDFLIEALRADIADGKLTMVYQPQVDRADQITGVEALARWNHRWLGPISPAEFVPLAESAGLIGDLGRLTYERALRDAKRWPNIGIALNVSALEIRSHGFAERFIALVRECGIDPKRVEVEITEGALLNKDGATMDALQELRSAGLRIALDDFGIGYSSLNYLRQFPVDKIKIDRSFVVGMNSNKGGEALVGAIIGLARALELSVIAEGVETAEERSQLLKLGCRNFQGYLTGRPVSADEICDRLERHAETDRLSG